MKKSVGIFGAGIAGLSCAHELAIAGYDVNVYESSDSIGGMAKSYRYPNGLPSENSWRGYGQFYKNIFHIMRQIPSPTSEPSNANSSVGANAVAFDKCPTLKLGKYKTVYDTELSRPIQFILPKDDIDNPDDAYNWTKNFTLKDWIVILMQMFREMAADERINYYAEINAMEYLKQKINPRNLTYIVSVFGPWSGIDWQRTSLHHITNFFRMIQYPDLSTPYIHDADIDGPAWTHGAGDQWLVLKRPTSESWFDPWAKVLTECYNVKFHFNHSLRKLNFLNGKINSTVIQTNSNLITVRHDYYIIATTPFAIKDIVDRSGILAQTDPQLKLFKELIADGPHIQISFRIGFKEKIVTPQKYMAFILPDSEYNITFYFQDTIWHDNVYLGPGNKTLISGGACVSYVPGKLFNKTTTEVSDQEFKDEILFQMFRCKNLNSVIANSNNGKKLSDFDINVFEIWKGWNFNPKFAIDVNEQKWVNSTHTNLFMPETKTSFPNLFLAGSHIKSSIDLYTMETACATGRDAAFMIINKNQKALVVNKPIWMNILGKIDNMLYAVNLPNIVDLTLFMLGCIIIFYLISLSKKT